MVYNVMTCTGPGWTMSVLGGCSMAWFTVAIIFLLVLVFRRQCGDGFLAGTAFNLWGAMILGLGFTFLLITLTGAAKWALLAGLGGIALGGFGGGMISDTSSSGGDDYE